MRICWAIWGLSSILTLTIRTAPLVARTVFSRIGPSCLHGPHQGAQKSTITGASNDPSTTSVMKVAVVTSFTAAGPAPAPPIKASLAIALLDLALTHNMAAEFGDDKRSGGGVGERGLCSTCRGLGLTLEIGE